MTAEDLNNAWETYFAIFIDGSASGGMNIEEVAATNSETIYTVSFSYIFK